MWAVVTTSADLGKQSAHSPINHEWCKLVQVHLVERIPFFDALYFVTTTLTTVGYGDVVVVSLLGKAAVLAMILVGVVLIPVQTSQLYSQLTARRLTLGMQSTRLAACLHQGMQNQAALVWQVYRFHADSGLLS